MGILDKLGTRLTESPDRIRAQEIRRFCRNIPAVQQIAECRTRSHARVVGIVQSIKFDPGESSARLEVRIFDGTDEIVGVWFGRKEIKGIRLGQPLVLDGTIVGTPDTKLQMMNPSYELLPAEEH
ncbi:MAG: OB-fold nucleic acid binding domain-containing protein [Acidimicrobiia bacterium]